MKETDRTAIIKKELEKMGGKFEETPDTLTIYPSKLHGAFIDGHHDHRIVMATSVAALNADGPSVIDNAEYAGVSYPNFYESLKSLGANIERLDIKSKGEWYEKILRTGIIIIVILALFINRL